MKIISLNIEKDRHFNRIIPFLKDHIPDIILLQEVLSKDVAYLGKTLGMASVFTILNSYKDRLKLGMLTLSRLPIIKNYSAYYRGDGANPPVLNYGEPEKLARAILVTEIIKENQKYCVLNTHFTWSPNGQPSALQNEDINILLDLLASIPEFVFCGDFNAPRGTAIFDRLASKYKDNIPADVKTTIDKNLHKAGDLKLVVDGIFSTPGYQVSSVKIVDGVSDHCAIVANINNILNLT